MSTHIILLRGVTPTGRNRVPMAPLRAALEAAGLRQVRTYIQSGNVLAASRLGQARLQALVHEVIAEQFGGDIAVLARSPAYFAQALQSVPFANAEPSKLYFTLLAQEPERELREAFAAQDFAPDDVRIVGDMVYLLCATRYSDSRFHNGFIERKLKLAATTRVFNTIAKLVELSGAAR